MGVVSSKLYPRNKYRRFVNQDWSEALPDHIFEEIIFFISLESLENLDTCRLVCKEWNKRIMTKLRAIRDHPSEKWKSILEKRIQKCWGRGNYPSDKMISHAKTLGIHIYTEVKTNLFYLLFFTIELIQTQSTSLLFIQSISCRDQKTSPYTLQ